MPALATECRICVRTLRLSRENRIFRPHLTVGRWRHPMGSQQELEGKLKRWNNFEFGESAVDEVVLFQSVLKQERRGISILSKPSRSPTIE